MSKCKCVFLILVQVWLRTEVLHTPSSTDRGSNSWPPDHDYISCHWDACSNHSAISDLNSWYLHVVVNTWTKFLSYLSSLFIPYKMNFNSRSNFLDKLETPRTRTTSYGDRAFVVVGAEEWNKLPLELKGASTVETFKTKLKTYLFKQCFK